MQDGILSDLSESFKSIVLDRFSSPLILSFSISWSIINFRLILIMFSGENIDKKLTLIDKYLFTPENHYLLYCFFYPFISSCLYVFIYPYFNRLILRFVLQRKLDEMKDKSDLEKSATFSFEDVQKLMGRHLKEIDSYKTRIKNLEQSESILQSQIDDLTKIKPETIDFDSDENTVKVASVESEPKPKYQELTNDMVNVINVLAHSENRGVRAMSAADITTSARIPVINTNIALDELQSRQLINKHTDLHSKVTYSLTKDGRISYIENMSKTDV